MSKVSVSRCAAETDKGEHRFEINEYNLHWGLGVGRFLQSANFTVGGYLWSVVFYPDGSHEDRKDWVSIGFNMISQSTGTVRASFILNFLHPTTIQPCSPVVPVAYNFHPACNSSIVKHFMKRDMLEQSGCIIGDCLKIHCTLTLTKEPRVAKVIRLGNDQPLPSNITEQLKKLLETQECTDVTFVVQGEEFPAHKLVMAIQSPVFKAQLYGPMMEKDMTRIVIPDMQPFVFRVLLQFLYRSYPSHLVSLDVDSKKEMIKHLLVAEDRYVVEWLKLACEISLCEVVDVKSMMNMLDLSDQHSCSRLNDACIRFMAFSGKADEVVETQAYNELKTTRPSMLIDMWEKINKHRST